MASKPKPTKDIQTVPLSAAPKVGDEYDIPVEGSLGLLALGAVGLTAWREKRAEAAAKAKKGAQHG